jgi:hypothetical protein
MHGEIAVGRFHKQPEEAEFLDLDPAQRITLKMSEKAGTPYEELAQAIFRSILCQKT